MAELFWLSDEQWQAIAPFMPTNQPGAHRKDDRTILSGILHVIKSGCRWKDCPSEYGPSTTVYNRWSRRRFWIGMLKALAKIGWTLLRSPTPMSRPRRVGTSPGVPDATDQPGTAAAIDPDPHATRSHPTSRSPTSIAVACEAAITEGLPQPTKVSARRRLGHCSLPASNADSVSQSCTSASTISSARMCLSASTITTRLRPTSFLAPS